MTELLLPPPIARDTQDANAWLTPAQLQPSLDDLFAFSAGRPLTRALLVRLSAIRKLVEEARRNGMLGAEEAANLTDVPNVRQQGTRLGNWLTKEQARELLQVPDRSSNLWFQVDQPLFWGLA